MKKDMVINWIKENIEHSAFINPSTSYGLKHILERDIGGYISNDDYKQFMLECGFKPVDYHELNWRFKIRLKPLVTGVLPEYVYKHYDYKRPKTKSITEYRNVCDLTGVPMKVTVIDDNRSVIVLNGTRDIYYSVESANSKLELEKIIKRNLYKGEIKLLFTQQSLVQAAKQLKK